MSQTTDRRQTDCTAIAYSERERKFTSAKSHGTRRVSRSRTVAVRHN